MKIQRAILLGLGVSVFVFNTTFSGSYSQELYDAYDYAYKNKITTMSSIDNADMNGGLTRIAMAKMLSQYAINILGKVPDTSKIPNFRDVTEQLDADYNNGVTLAYQLGIMGVGIDKFRPHDSVTRAEFGTALSRVLYGSIYNQEGKDYYSKHLNALKNAGIMTKIDKPFQLEVRGYVMLMLMRSDGDVSVTDGISGINCEEKKIKTACLLEMDTCPNVCKGVLGSGGYNNSNNDFYEVTDTVSDNENNNGVLYFIKKPGTHRGCFEPGMIETISRIEIGYIIGYSNPRIISIEFEKVGEVEIEQIESIWIEYNNVIISEIYNPSGNNEFSLNILDEYQEINYAQGGTDIRWGTKSPSYYREIRAKFKNTLDPRVYGLLDFGVKHVNYIGTSQTGKHYSVIHITGGNENVNIEKMVKKGYTAPFDSCGPGISCSCPNGASGYATNLKMNILYEGKNQEYDYTKNINISKTYFDLGEVSVITVLPDLRIQYIVISADTDIDLGKYIDNVKINGEEHSTWRKVQNNKIIINVPQSITFKYFRSNKLSITAKFKSEFFEGNRQIHFFIDNISDIKYDSHRIIFKQNKISLDGPTIKIYSSDNSSSSDSDGNSNQTDNTDSNDNSGDDNSSNNNSSNSDNESSNDDEDDNLGTSNNSSNNSIDCVDIDVSNGHSYCFGITKSGSGKFNMSVSNADELSSCSISKGGQLWDFPKCKGEFSVLPASGVANLWLTVKYNNKDYTKKINYDLDKGVFVQ